MSFQPTSQSPFFQIIPFSGSVFCFVFFNNFFEIVNRIIFDDYLMSIGGLSIFELMIDGDAGLEVVFVSCCGEDREQHLNDQQQY